MDIEKFRNNRSLTLVGANKLFSAIDIRLFKDPLGFYYSEGYMKLQKPTLTELCQTILIDLMSVKEQSDNDQKTIPMLQTQQELTTDEAAKMLKSKLIDENLLEHQRKTIESYL